MSTHKEIAFEEEICEHLGSHGWIYVEGDASKYDRARALFPDDVLAWVQTTQPDAWEALVKNHGAAAGETLLNRLRDSLNQRGTLDVGKHADLIVTGENYLSCPDPCLETMEVDLTMMGGRIVWER